MVNAGRERLEERARIDVAKKSLFRAAQEIGVTRPTLEKWILQGKVSAKRMEFQGRIYHEIDDSEIARVKALIPKKRPHGGQPLI